MARLEVSVTRSWLILALAIACKTPAVPASPDTDDTDTDGVATDDTDTDLGDTDVGDTDAVDTDPPAPTPIRFVALGDGGEGNPAQYAVGRQMATVCAARGCDFALYLGDNFYNTGVKSVDDDQFQDKFELPYADLDFPFYVALGNHDYGGEGLGIEFWKADPQIEYTERSEKWTMPDRFYEFFVDDVQFVAFDTNAVLYDVSEDQRSFAQDVSTHPARLRIGFGHHPFISNGPHGNAGNYEGMSSDLPFVEIPRGDYVRDFFEDHVCGNFDLYFSGHDHDRQWLKPTCGTEFIVSGAAAKNSDFKDRGNPVWFEDYQKPGFVWVEILGDVVTLGFYNIDGTLEYEDVAGR